MCTLAELHAMPEIPSIAHFCSLFKDSFDLLELEIDEFESALLKQNTEDIFASTLVERLTVRLVIGCLPMYASNIHEGNFSTYLRQLLQAKKEEAEEDGYEFKFEDPFEENDVEDFSDLDVKDQVKVIYQLTEFRLECGDVAGKLKDLDPEGLRIEPLGVDSDNVFYWYFFGTRLYKEVKPMKAKRPKKSKKDEVEKADEEEEEEKVEKEPRDPLGWYLACSSEGEWKDLVAKYKKSKKKQDKELYETLNDNFLPDILKMFDDQEKEERLKLLMANKRSSSRLDRKREEEEKVFMRRMEEERRLEMERAAEEARRKQIEKENKLKSREVRAKQREQLGLRVGSDPDALMANRKRIRGDSIEQREEETEELSSQSHTRKKNPAMKEFQRLASLEEDPESHAGRNLRL